MLNFLFLPIVLIIIHPTFTFSSCNVDPITYFLNNQIINVPDANILVTGNNYLRLRRTTCSHFKYTNIDSSYQPLTTIPIEIDGISFECVGDYSYTFLKGKVKSILNQLSVSMSATFNKSQPLELPNGFSINSCKVSKVIIRVSFSGGNVVDKSILNTMSDILRNYIENEIKTKLCETLVPALEGNITNYLVYQVDPQLTAIIQSPTSNVPPAFLNMSTYINWNATLILIENIQRCIEMSSTSSKLTPPSVISTNIPLLTVARPSMKQTLQQDIMSLITASKSPLSLPLNIIVPIQSAYLYINSLTISGLHTFTDIDLLSPSHLSDISIHSIIKLSNLSFVFNMTYQAQPAIKCYNESLQLKLQLSDLLINMDTSIAINKNKFKSYGLYKMFNTGCLLSTIDYFNISSLKVKCRVLSIQLLQIQGSATHYEKDINHLINNVFRLFTNGYSKFLTEFITGLFQSIIRQNINQMLTKNILTIRTQFPCSQPSTTSSSSNICSYSFVSSF